MSDQKTFSDFASLLASVRKEAKPQTSYAGVVYDVKKEEEDVRTLIERSGTVSNARQLDRAVSDMLISKGTQPISPQVTVRRRLEPQMLRSCTLEWVRDSIHLDAHLSNVASEMATRVLGRGVNLVKSALIKIRKVVAATLTPVTRGGVRSQLRISGFNKVTRVDLFVAVSLSIRHNDARKALIESHSSCEGSVGTMPKYYCTDTAQEVERRLVTLVLASPNGSKSWTYENLTCAVLRTDRMYNNGLSSSDTTDVTGAADAFGYYTILFNISDASKHDTRSHTVRLTDAFNEWSTESAVWGTDGPGTISITSSDGGVEQRLGFASDCIVNDIGASTTTVGPHHIFTVTFKGTEVGRKTQVPTLSIPSALLFNPTIIPSNSYQIPALLDIRVSRFLPLLMTVMGKLNYSTGKSFGRSVLNLTTFSVYGLESPRSASKIVDWLEDCATTYLTVIRAVLSDQLSQRHGEGNVDNILFRGYADEVQRLLSNPDQLIATLKQFNEITQPNVIKRQIRNNPVLGMLLIIKNINSVIILAWVISAISCRTTFVPLPKGQITRPRTGVEVFNTIIHVTYSSLLLREGTGLGGLAGTLRELFTAKSDAALNFKRICGITKSLMSTVALQGAM